MSPGPGRARRPPAAGPPGRVRDWESPAASAELRLSQAAPPGHLDGSTVQGRAAVRSDPSDQAQPR
eukprot:753536-Hanusia_phi.AAC.1